MTEKKQDRELEKPLGEKTFKQRTGKLVEKDKQNETEEKGMSLQLQAFHHEQRIIEQVVVKLPTFI